MPETVEFLTSGELTGPLPRRLRVVLRYRADDPYAVHLCFPSGARFDEEPGAGSGLSWTVGRELLAEGSHTPAGLGDLRLRPLPSAGTVRLTFHSAEGFAAFHLEASDLQDFLAASYRLVPPGTESERLCWPETAEEFANRLF
ncbi:SsgA family sporulation/cell division regulator [Kitasatospora sp. NBC_01250]|uniref:SsgA family sporulation/cell division regulator n=1 Tax=unclassified Kitasatospora TaxID=2633591 RepID=UPI002E155DCE|nr:MULTISPECIES: SsgA family sporulation/cell division regulator [unclassified Kitasatospora]WSJ65639.1 SsgA family sporulation/cell division regulator [Kitasatospora sp. NBC_01302]